MRRIDLGLAILATGLVSAASASEREDDGQVVFVVQHVDVERGGTVLCGLYEDEQGWLGDYPFRFDKQAARDDIVTCVFERVPPGTYAVAAMHDEDGDEEMDEDALGLPSEGHCASRDAQEAGFGAPDWRDAAVRYDGRASLLTARMSY